VSSRLPGSCSGADNIRRRQLISSTCRRHIDQRQPPASPGAVPGWLAACLRPSVARGTAPSTEDATALTANDRPGRAILDAGVYVWAALVLTREINGHYSLASCNDTMAWRRGWSASKPAVRKTQINSADISLGLDKVTNTVINQSTCRTRFSRLKSVTDSRNETLLYRSVLR